MDNTFKYLVNLFRKLPGVGPRQAGRFVLALLERSQPELEELGNAIIELRQSVRFCRECFNLTDNSLCKICTDKRRDTAKLMVVEKVTDLISVERTGLYRGLYHVLGGAINPVDDITPEKLNISELENRIQNLADKSKSLEVILATNPSASGDTTLLYLRERLAVIPNITLTRLARGLSSGTNLEYADDITLKHALEKRA
jgi:recombination protein RecR